MRQKTDCFIACRTLAEVEPAIEQLRRSNSVRHIFLLVSEELANEAVAPQDCSFVVTDNLSSTQFVMKVAELTVGRYALLCLKAQPMTLGSNMLERLLLVAGDEHAAMVFSDRYTVEQGERKPHPVIDYQEGSLRDDFDFGVPRCCISMPRWNMSANISSLVFTTYACS